MKVIDLVAEINIGDIVELKAEPLPDCYVVVGIGRWLRRGQMKIRRYSLGGTVYERWCWPARPLKAEAVPLPSK